MWYCVYTSKAALSSVRITVTLFFICNIKVDNCSQFLIGTSSNSKDLSFDLLSPILGEFPQSALSSLSKRITAKVLSIIIIIIIIMQNASNTVHFQYKEVLYSLLITSPS